MRRKILLGGALAMGGGSAYLFTGPRRRKSVRAFDFWSRALPVYAHYRFTEWRMADAPEEERDAAFDVLHERYACKSFQDILHMRGLYIKLGQIMTSRADYAPPAYMKEFMALQDAVPAKRFSEIRDDVEQGLGMKLDDVFASIEEEPLGAATIGQVHGARLRDGSDVVIKFQYPEVEELFKEDLETVITFCSYLQPEYVPMLEEMRRQFMTEFDFTREGWALQTIGDGVRSVFRNVEIPVPYREYCTKTVCVMERKYGMKLVDALNEYYEEAAHAEGLTMEQFREVQLQKGKQNTSAFQMELYRTWLRTTRTLFNWVATLFNYTLGVVLPNITYASSVLPVNHVAVINTLLHVHGWEIFCLGTFNGDPHPGNIWLSDDHSELILIDYGQVKIFTPAERLALAKMILAICSDDAERIVEQFKELGFSTRNNDAWVIEKTARFFFEDDTDPLLLRTKDGSKQLNVQQFTEYLNAVDATDTFPEFCFMAIRTGMLIRGLASHLQMGVNVAHVWKPYAEQCIRQLEPKD